MSAQRDSAAAYDDATIRPSPSDEPRLSDDPHAGLELIAAKGWRGVEQSRLGDWLLRAGHGFTGRANSALALGDPGMPLVAAADAVIAWYAERGLTPMVQLPVPPSAQIARHFVTAGWTETNAALVMTAGLEQVKSACTPPLLAPAVHITPEPTAGWLSGYQYRGAALPASAIEVLVNADDVGFAEVREGDEVIAVARGAVNDGWMGVTAVTVDESYRRRGLGNLLMHALSCWAADRAESVYLQVSPDNAVAIAMYERIGFTELHRYHYRIAPSAR